MDATPRFGVTMIPEVPSNPQLTLVQHPKSIAANLFFYIFLAILSILIARK